jgi:Holliday junction DNA helicase, RuvA subunit
MFHHLRGKLVHLSPTEAIVENQGLGYRINITLTTYAALNGQAEVFLYLLPIFKEDDQSLYGFTDAAEREMFKLLLSVSGVGGNTARLILSGLDAGEAASAIIGDEAQRFQAVKGVGAKTAQRIILDLKDKVAQQWEGLSVGSGHSPSRQEALAALETLGYPRRLRKKR